MSKNNSTKNSGITFGSLLQLAFIILKLCGVIDWSWVWVLSPMWIGAIVVVVWAAAFVLLLHWLDS